MSDLQTFQYQQSQIRLAKIDEEGEPWFVAKDVCDVLALSNVSDTVQLLDDDEKGIATVDTLGGPQQVAIVSAPGLYSLVLRSRKPEAKAFKRWVTHEVLPQIHKTGRYTPQPMSPLDMIRSQSLAIVQMVDNIQEAQKTATEALQKAEENRSQIAVLVERQQTAMASIPTLPAPTQPAIPRTPRSNVIEILRAAALANGGDFSAVTTRAYRELKYRTKTDVQARARNSKPKVRAIDIVDRLNLMDQLYAICVDLFGRPTNPLPNSASGSDEF